MRRFVILVTLFLFTIPFGISISGCSKKTAVIYCNGSDSGPVVGELQNIVLQPRITGISLNVGEQGQVSAPTATDCKNNPVSVTSWLYGTSDMTIADVQPTTGKLCGGTWNRNSGGGVPDFTTCVPTGKTGTVSITASATGGSAGTSNPIPIYIHTVVTSIQLVTPVPAGDCSGTDPATNCSPAATTATSNNVGCVLTTNGNGCCQTPIPLSGTPLFSATSCVSQTQTAQLAAKLYDANGNNISCKVGSLNYLAQTAGVVTFDPNGLATAQQPGSTVVTTNLSNAGSSAGFFSTCPPVTIALGIPQPNGSLSPSGTVTQNSTQPLTAIATDKNGIQLTGLTLQYVTTTPNTIPTSTSGSITPTFPGTTEITAQCVPPSCNPAPVNEIGFQGNGQPITSTPVTITTPGINSTQLFIASTQSQYIVPIDFTTTAIGAPVRLPFVPNSMIISDDGSSIYMGNAFEMMVYSALTNGLTAEYPNLPGTVLAVSPDSSTVVVSDSARQLIYLASSSGAITTQTGGVGTHAEFSSDSTTVYITTGNQLQVHSTYTGWHTIPLSTPATDVAVTVPAVGAYFAGATTTARSYCTNSDTNGLTFYPQVDTVAVQTDRVTATSDGDHILGATVANGPKLVDLKLGTGTATGLPTQSCPSPVPADYFKRTATTQVPLTGVAATAITGILPTSDSVTAFITYTGAGKLPVYSPQTGAINYITLSGAATAPVAGAVSTDNSTFYLGTSGDNAVHILTNGTNGFVDTTTPIVPNLPSFTGGTGAFATPDLIVQKPRKSIS